MDRTIRINISENLLQIEQLLKQVVGTKKVYNHTINLILIVLYLISVPFLSYKHIGININTLFVIIVTSLFVYSIVNIYTKETDFLRERPLIANEYKRKIENILPLVPIYYKISKEEILYYTTIFNNNKITNIYFNNLKEDDLSILAGLFYCSKKINKSNHELKDLINEKSVVLWQLENNGFKVLILDDNNNPLYDNFFDLENTPKLDYKFHWKDYEK